MYFKHDPNYFIYLFIFFEDGIYLEIQVVPSVEIFTYLVNQDEWEYTLSHKLAMLYKAA